MLALTVVAASTVAIAQTAQANRSRPFAPGTCGPVDPAYIRAAEATGGIPFFFQRSEVGVATKYMTANSGENRVTVLWAKGTLQNSSRDFTVPIDSTLTKTVFVVSTDNHATKMEVFDSGGTPISTSRQSDTTDFTCGRYIVAKDLPSGDYRIRVTGVGRFWLSVQGQSTVFLHEVEFVELAGRPGHQGMFPIQGEPLVAKRAQLQASISGSAKDVSFSLISPEAAQLKSITMKRTDQDQYGGQQFEGALGPPTEPFRVIATGHDEKGNRFQRVHEALFRPTTIEITLHEMASVLAGQTALLTFQVKNLGPPETFRVNAVCANRWPVKVERTEVALAKGESASVSVNVSVPAETSPYSLADLVFMVSSKSNPDLSNAFIQKLSLDPADH